MANTIGWGKGTQNNSNGWGKFQNTIGAASVYADSYAGETVLIGASAAFSYSASSFHQGEADPTPTITGTTGGTFSATPSGLSINTSTGTIDLDASTIQSYTVTYTVSGVSAQQSLDVTAAPFSNEFSFEFDGVDERFTTGLNLGFTSYPNFSISYWINTNASFTDFQSYFAIAVNVSYGSGMFNFSAGRLNKTQTKLVVGVQGNGSASGTTALDDGQWHHIIQTYSDNGNNTQRVRIYVDGNTTPEVDLASTLSYAPLTGDLFIGARNSSNDRAFPGNIDEVSVFNTALGSSDITTIYNSGTPNDLSSHSNLIAWYRMGDEANFESGTWTLTNQGSSSNNATSSNMEEADRKSDTP